MTREERREYDKNRRYELKKWFREEFMPTQKCCKCGENHPACIDFHHVDPTSKEKGIARVLHDSLSKNTLLKELKKCIAVCSNCHRKLHHEEMMAGEISKGYSQHK